MAHKSRLITTFLVQALGVAFVSGVLVLTDTVNRTFDDLFSDVFRDTDAVVRSNQEIDQGFGGGEVRGRSTRTGRRGARRRRRGRRRRVGGRLRPHHRQGRRPDGQPGHGAPTFGTNWGMLDASTPSPSPTAFSESDDEVVIDRRSAKNAGYEVGDTSRSKPRPAQLTTRCRASPSSAAPTARAEPRSPCSRWRRPSGCWASPARSA